MKFVCEINKKTFLFDDENLTSPREAAGLAFKAYDKQKGLFYDTEYKVSVYDDTGVSIFPVKKEEKYDYTCSIEQYNMELDCKADNPYTACVKALLETARDVVFEGKEVIEIDAYSEEGANGTYHFVIHGPAVRI